MKFKDKLRYLRAKILRRETVLFSQEDFREQGIREAIRGYVAFFYEFNEVNPNEFDLVVLLTIRAQRYLNEHPKF